MSDLEADSSDDNSEQLTDKQRAQLQDKETQEKYRREYLRQLRQRECPGCGDDGLF